MIYYFKIIDIVDVSCIHRARERWWNWLGHILRMEEHRVIRQVLMNCVKPTPDTLFGDVSDPDSRKAVELVMNCVRPTPDSIFGDVPDPDSRKAAELEADREKWKSLRPSKRC